MKHAAAARICLACALVSGVPGCASYVPVRLPGAMPRADSRSSGLAWAGVGANARAVLVSGETVSGEITAVTDSSVTIGQVGNYGLQERTLTAAELARLEVEDQGGIASVAIGVVAVTAVIVVVALAVLTARLDRTESGS